MDIQKCRAFVTVVEKKSISLAAKEMGYSQPGISHMIDALEREVGFPLLIRGKSPIYPTPAGEELLYHCREIIRHTDQFDETVMSISGLLRGKITIGSYQTLLKEYVPELISAFHRIHKDISINVIEYANIDLQRSLHDGEVDFGFMCRPIPPNFEFYPLFDDPYCLIMNEFHPLAAYEKIPTRAIQDCDFLTPQNGWDEILQDILATTGSELAHSTFHVSSDTGSIAMAAKGLGVFATSVLQTAYLPDGAVFREFEDELHRSVGIAVKSLKNASPAAREFIRFAIRQAHRDEKDS